MIQCSEWARHKYFFTLGFSLRVFIKFAAARFVTRNESVSVIQLKKYDDNRNILIFIAFYYRERYMHLYMRTYVHNVNLYWNSRKRFFSLFFFLITIYVRNFVSRLWWHRLWLNSRRVKFHLARLTPDQREDVIRKVATRIQFQRARKGLEICTVDEWIPTSQYIAYKKIKKSLRIGCCCVDRKFFF